MRYDVPLIDHAMNDYFRDHPGPRDPRGGGIDNLRDLLTAALEANLLLVSLAQKRRDQETHRLGPRSSPSRSRSRRSTA